MFFAISKIYIESDQMTTSDLKELTQLCQKLQSKYKISAKPLAHTENRLSFAIALLSSSRNAALQKLDEIVQFTEQSGIGRVENEISLVDHIDAFEDEESSDEEDERAFELKSKKDEELAYKIRH